MDPESSTSTPKQQTQPQQNKRRKDKKKQKAQDMDRQSEDQVIFIEKQNRNNSYKPKSRDNYRPMTSTHERNHNQAQQQYRPQNNQDNRYINQTSQNQRNQYQGNYKQENQRNQHQERQGHQYQGHQQQNRHQNQEHQRHQVQGNQHKQQQRHKNQEHQINQNQQQQSNQHQQQQRNQYQQQQRNQHQQQQRYHDQGRQIQEGSRKQNQQQQRYYDQGRQMQEEERKQQQGQYFDNERKQNQRHQKQDQYEEDYQYYVKGNDDEVEFHEVRFDQSQEKKSNNEKRQRKYKNRNRKEEFIKEKDNKEYNKRGNNRKGKYEYKQKEIIYSKYLEVNDVEKMIEEQEEKIENGQILIEENKFYKGIYMANTKKNMKENGFVKVNLLNGQYAKIHVTGITNINRAFHNNKVVVQILAKIKKQEENKKEKAKEEQEEEQDVQTQDDKKEDILTKDDKKEENKEEEIHHKQGKVVCIIENQWATREMVGKVRLNLDKNREYFYYTKFIAVDANLPWFDAKNIYYDQQKKDLKIFREICEQLRRLVNRQKKEGEVKQKETLEAKLKETKIKIEKVYVKALMIEQGEQDQHIKVDIVKGMEGENDLDVECKVMLESNQIEEKEFEQETIDELMKLYKNYNLDNEMTNREDLRHLDIFSIDPETARDLDDALHVRKLKENLFEVGVHIADVSHFVKINSRTDKEAKERTTSIYLPHRVIPMLPRILCEQLCSLTPDADKLAFSVIFNMNGKGVIDSKSVRFCKSRIRSRCKYSYQEAQIIIDRHLGGEEMKGPLEESVRMLYELATEMRDTRLEEGCVVFPKQKYYFKVSQECNVSDYSAEKRMASNYLVEEFMLVANRLTATFITKHNPTLSFLRNHPMPHKEPKINYAIDLLVHFGLMKSEDTFDQQVKHFQESKKLNKLLNDIVTHNELSDVNKQNLVLNIMKTMEAAQYMMYESNPIENKQEQQYRGGNKYHHFALNMDYYTHFTSPIRRYPDIIVHRCLASILDNQQDKHNAFKQEYEKVTALCNQMKKASRKINEEADSLCMKLYVAQSPITTKALLLKQSGNTLTFFVPQVNSEVVLKLSSIKDFVIQKDNKQDKKKNNDQEYYLLPQTYIFKGQQEGEQQLEMTFKKYQEYEIVVTSSDDFPKNFVLGLKTEEGRTLI